MTQLESPIESTVAIAKSSNSIITNKTRSESINTLKQVKELFIKFNSCDEERHELFDSYIDPEPVEAETVEMPTMEDYPEKPVYKEPHRNYSEIIEILIAIALSAICYLVGNFYLIPEHLYEAHLSYTVFGYELNEFAISSAVIFVLGFIWFCWLQLGNSAKYRCALATKRILTERYEKQCKNVDAHNAQLSEEYQASLKKAKEDAEAKTTELMAKADETNVLLDMKIESVNTTMRHLQDRYMVLYSKVIPNEFADIEHISALLKIFENDESVTTISQAIKIAKEEA